LYIIDLLTQIFLDQPYLYLYIIDLFSCPIFWCD